MRKGLTLIEVLLAMGTASVISVLLLVVIVNSAGVFYKQSSKVQEGLNINDALAEIKSSIKQASSVAESYTWGSTTYTTSANQLVLRVASIDPSGDILSDTYDYFVVFTDQNILYFKIFPDPSSFRQLKDRVFSTSVDSLNFQYFNSDTPPVETTPVNAAKIVTTLTLKQKSGVGFETSIAISEANLRND